MNIENYVNFLIYAIAYLVIATAMKYILNVRSIAHYTADDQISSGNLAVGLRRSGAQLGLAIAMIGVLSGGSSPDLIKDLMATLGYGALAVAFMLTSLFITDKALLPHVDNTAELKDGNIAVGMVEFGSLVMTGILAYASIKGDEGGVISSIVYFTAGQATLILLVLFYEHVFAKKLNPVKCVSEGNKSAGIYLAGKIIAYGLILQSAIVGNGNGTSAVDGAISFAVAAVAGMVLLYIFEILIDILIITSTKVSTIIIEDQMVAATQLTFSKIGMALILGMAIL